jgi:diguanylate cyclase (GGDEF)-like protein
VLIIDLDHFKSINDRFGHAFGDQMLEIFADTARQSVRSTDLLGRIGGEEFAVLLPNMNRNRALAIAERIRANFAQAAVEVGATVSIGLAHCQDDAELDVPELLAQADQALYCAKKNGRNRVESASLAMMLKSKNAAASTTATVVAMAARRRRK